MSTFFPEASGFMINGGTFNASTTNNHISQLKRGIDVLMDWIATDAFHNSRELYDAPKCHPHTRVAVLADIMKWVIESEAQDELMMWLFGPAGAGKSAIAKKIAELAAEKDLLIGSFFFSRTSPTRSTQDRLIPTLAYQMALSIPDTRTYIQDAIETDPAIFHKDIRTQIDTLLNKPFQFASTENIPCPKLFIIDGLDECNDRKSQIAILDAISHSFTTHKLPIRCLVASRPEIDLVTSFNGKEPLKSLHRRLALDDTYQPDDDIRRFFSDKFEEIRYTHRLGSAIPIPWPSEELLETLVKKSSGQFIFAATVIRFVESNRHRPAERLNIILGISPPGTINPFAELDALYKHILSSVEDIQLTLRVLSLYASLPQLADRLRKLSMLEFFLSLGEGDIDRALIDLSSIVSDNEPSGKFTFLHASFVDFLSDKHRSNEFYIDVSIAHADFACRTLQFVKGPGGIRAGDYGILAEAIWTDSLIPNSQLRNEILDFDLDAFITAAMKSPHLERNGNITMIYDIWIYSVIIHGKEKGLDDSDVELLTRRLRNTFESRVQKYQSDWRLKLLLTLALVMDGSYSLVPKWRLLDILVEMDNDDLRLVDQDALNLRCFDRYSFFTMFTDEMLRDITSRYVNGDSYASAALHCMHFLSNPPQFSENESDVNLQIGITYDEWKATCKWALDMLCKLLTEANTSPEIIHFMTENNISITLQKILPSEEYLWEQVNMNIDSFLSRGDVGVDMSTKRLDLSASDPSQSDSSEENDSDIYKSAEESDYDIYESAEENGSDIDKPEDNGSDTSSV